MCTSLDSLNESHEQPSLIKDMKLREELRVYEEECSRGIVHTRSYDIKMEQYRLSGVKAAS